MKQPTAQLLDLIDQKGQQHQQGKDGGQVLLAVAIVMLQAIALVLERSEGFVFDLPPRPPAAHDGLHRVEA